MQPFLDDSCDRVTALDVLDYISDSDVEAILSSNFRILKVQGLMLILINHPEYPQAKIDQKEGRQEVINYYRDGDRWNYLLGKTYSCKNTKGEEVKGFFRKRHLGMIPASEKVLQRYPEILDYYFDQTTGENRKVRLAITLEKSY